MKINMLEFLLENDVIICSGAKREMTADQALDFNGEFVVYDYSSFGKELYRGADFDEAVKFLNGKD